MRFFFYGTLMDRELLEQVLQRPVPVRALRPARLAGWRRCAIRGHDFPGIARHRGTSVDGVVLDHPAAADRVKLLAYEGEGYAIARTVVALSDGCRQTALIFVPRPGFYRLMDADWRPLRGRLSPRSFRGAAK